MTGSCKYPQNSKTSKSAMVKDIKLYDILNVPPTATLSEIKKSYKSAALQYHPDKNHDNESAKQLFQEISEAYRILSDANTRNVYDRYGTVDESEISAIVAQQQQQQQQQQQRGNLGATGGLSAGELFAHFFGGGSTTGKDFSFFSSSLGTSQNVAMNLNGGTVEHGPDIKHKMKCTLEDLYHGKVAKLALTRTRICSHCSGNGGLQSSACGTCNGQGMFTQTRRHGPVVQTWSSTCKSCCGTGTYVKSKDICQTCEGNSFVTERKIFKVEARPGMRNSSIVIFPGEADEVISTVGGKQQVIPGDLVITIQEERGSSRYHRYKDCDLILNRCPVDLRTSLCGGSIFIDDHPSGRKIKVEIVPGELLRPGVTKCVEHLGMPRVDNPTSFGNLYIKFHIQYPTVLSSDTILTISKAFDSDAHMQELRKDIKPSSSGYGVYEEHFLSNFLEEPPDLKRKRQHTTGVHKKRRWDNRDDCYDFYGYDEEELEGKGDTGTYDDKQHEDFSSSERMEST